VTATWSSVVHLPLAGLVGVLDLRYKHPPLVQKSFLLASCFFSQAVHNIMALVDKFQRAQQENRLCKHVYTGGLLNYTACVNFTFTQAA